MHNIDIIEEINDGNQNVYLRKVSLDDANFLFESLKEKVISKYLSLGPLSSHSHSKKLSKKYLKFWDDKIQFNYIIELRENMNEIKKIGSISLWDLSWLHHRAKIGVWITPKYWNMGYAKIALKLITIIGFSHLRLNRLEAQIAVENVRSISLFKKSGFVEEGLLLQYLKIRGNYHDALIFSYLKARWNQNRFNK